MTRPSPALARSFTLALTIMLVGSTLALPAVADDGVVGPRDGIISPSGGDAFAPDDTIELSARVAGGSSTTPSWALRQGADIRGAGDDFTRAGNVDGASSGPLHYDGNDTYSISLDLTELDLDLNDFEVEGEWYTGTTFFFVFNWDGTAGDDTRDEVAFSIDPLADFDADADEIEECVEGEECTIKAVGAQTFTASTETPAKEGQTARLGLRIPGAGDDVSDAVFAACQDQLDDDQRLGGEVAHLVPVGFDGGSLTVANLIPRSVINSDVNRGNPSFQICVAPTAAEAELYEDAGYNGLGTLGTTGLVGPILLADCADADQTACVESRQRQRRADLLITFRIPAADPWMM